MVKSYKNVLAECKNSSVIIWGAGEYGINETLPLLKDQNISVEAFCDNNQELWNKEILEGIYCIAPSKIKNNSVIIIGIKNNEIARTIKEELLNKGYRSVITFEELQCCRNLSLRGKIRYIKKLIKQYYRKLIWYCFKFDEWHIATANDRLYVRFVVDSVNKMNISGKVVEVGCGLGDVLSKINARDKEGYDISTNVIRAAKFIHPLIKTYVGSFENIKNKRIEILIAVNILHILPDNEFRKDFDELLKNNHVNRIIVDKVPSPPYANSHDFIHYFGEKGYYLEQESREYTAYEYAKRKILIFKKEQK